MKMYELNTLPKSFWNWFGNSVIKENNLPIVCYHGSNSHAYIGGEIDAFHTNPPSGRGAAFFTSSLKLAQEYGEKIYSVYLKIENPLIVHGNGKYWSGIDKSTKIGGTITPELRKAREQLKQRKFKDKQELDDIFKELEDAGFTQKDYKYTPEIEQELDDNDLDLEKYNLGVIPNLTEYSTDQIVKQAKKLGYDGVIFKNIKDSPTFDKFYHHEASDVYAVFRQNQIKSVNNIGTYDPENPHIREEFSTSRSGPTI